jgi:hypothetical protein
MTGKESEFWERVVFPQKKLYDENFYFPSEQRLGSFRVLKKVLRSDLGESGFSLNLFHRSDKEIESVIVYLHQYYGKAPDGLFLLDNFIEDSAILLYDLSGHGNSPEILFTFGVTESQNLLQICLQIQ